jgi:hypothetical protein
MASCWTLSKHPSHILHICQSSYSPTKRSESQPLGMICSWTHLLLLHFVDLEPLFSLLCKENCSQILQFFLSMQLFFFLLLNCKWCWNSEWTNTRQTA